MKTQIHLMNRKICLKSDKLQCYDDQTEIKVLKMNQ